MHSTEMVINDYILKEMYLPLLLTLTLVVIIIIVTIILIKKSLRSDKK